MLKDAAPLADCGESCGKASAVIALLPSHPSRGAARGVASPAFAGRMGHDWPGPRIEARIAAGAPRVDAWESDIGPLLVDVECCDLMVIQFTHLMRLPLGPGGN